MARLHLLVLATACACAYALPPIPASSPSPGRNTIFAEEKFAGEPFENIDFFNVRNDANEIYRLPRTTVPDNYNVMWDLDMNPADLRKSGTVDITLHATEAGVQEIVLHSNQLNIISVRLERRADPLNPTDIPVTFELEEQYHFLRVRLQSVSQSLEIDFINPVYYNLIISFEAPLRSDMYGIYRSWYKNSPNETEIWMASTQFQSTASRSAFPCYDEPSFKATFDVRIRRPISYSSWSSTKIRVTNNITATTQEDIFYTSPRMSTYLLAIIVADYWSVSDDDGDYEVIARPAAIEAGQGQYAFDVGQELLAEMSAHTGIDYYSTAENLKMTQAAIPDFGAGAMENWGLLTYREAYLMYDEEHTNGYYQQLIAYILSHEIAHMWFGNLVTCDWWDVLWLNEGFARYYQYFLTHWVETHMGFETRFIVEQVHTSLLTDSAANAHPLNNQGVYTPAQVSAMFSTISYNKGAAVIRMTEHLMGFDVHEQGLQNYLTEKAFDYALPIELFTSLEAAGIAAGAFSAYGDFSLVDYYKSWTDQAGHPVLNVNVNHATGQMTITQRRFDINNGYAVGDGHTIYQVPISFASASNPNFNNTKPTHIMNSAVAVIDRGSIGDEWVIFNIQQTGFYRVNYDDYTWSLIALALRGPARTQIHEYNKAQIVNDVFQFARSGLMTYTRAFDILSFLRYETEYAPWVAALTGFSWIRNRLVLTPALTEVNNLIEEWSSDLIGQLGYYPIANESFMRSYLRYQLAPVLCNIGVQGCLTAANAQFRNLVDNGAEVAVDSRNWVYCNGLRGGLASDYNFMYERFLNHQVYTEKITILQNLGCTSHAPSLNSFMASIISPALEIREQDYTTAFNSAVSGNEANTQIALTFIQENLANVIAAFGSPVTPLSYVSARLRTEQEVNAFQNWANTADLGTARDSVINSAEATRQSIQWYGQVNSDFTQYFEENFDVITTTTSTAAPVVVPQIESMPDLVAPVTPELPSSAATSLLSIFAFVLAAAVHFVL